MEHLYIMEIEKLLNTSGRVNSALLRENRFIKKFPAEHNEIIQPGKDEEHLVLESVNAFYKPKEFHKSLIKSFYSIKGVIKKEMM